MNKILIAFFSLLLLSSCSTDREEELETDKTAPTIDLTIPGAFPVSCSNIQRGTTITLKASFSDNMELGSYGVDIHNNFDHHNHSTETGDCGLDPVKTPVNPYLLIESYPIPAGNKQYTSSQEITIPADVDPGDYHFMIRVVDKTGWQTIKGLSIKITP